MTALALMAMTSRRAVANPAYIGPLDGIGGVLSAAYSTRRLLSAYTGNCCRLRKATGGAEATIGFDSAGIVNLTAVTAHLSGDTGFMAALYNQSGVSGRDLTQAAANAQPEFMSSGVNSKPVAKFDGVTARFWNGPAGSSVISAQTGYAVFSVQADGVQFSRNVAGQADVIWCGFSSGLEFRVGPHIVGWNSDAIDADAVACRYIVVPGVYIIEWMHQNGLIGIAVNKGSWYWINSQDTSNIGGTMRIGASADTQSWLKGRLVEALFYSGIPTSAQRDVIVDRLAAYAGVTQLSGAGSAMNTFSGGSSPPGSGSGGVGGTGSTGGTTTTRQTVL